MTQESKIGKAVELAIDQAFNECKIKIYESYIKALDQIQSDLQAAREDNSFTVEEILKREG